MTETTPLSERRKVKATSIQVASNEHRDFLVTIPDEETRPYFRQKFISEGSILSTTGRTNKRNLCGRRGAVSSHLFEFL